MSDSVRPHRQQPIRLLCPWDSPGKNTGVGCHFLLQCMKVKSESEVAQSCPTLRDPIDDSPPDSPVPGILQARTQVGCHFLLQSKFRSGIGIGLWCFGGACWLYVVFVYLFIVFVLFLIIAGSCKAHFRKLKWIKDDSRASLGLDWSSSAAVLPAENKIS